ncbi:Re/Si-specific NAD(P)(+) transhydrogenase subunit alpha [Arcanobacterium ihumii]|uniref:Re/Si-specific NAD(P)(+) transhydrogenase subunit alpha n=1 Tax=Arcanobacterium ihumii TaxID=2138162 RepID=UPI000F54BC86|nr:Re/Si-specific NAD(P)(+) transhydrogenase subunit alpha [Arcanobacterium ihumii]
MQIGVPREPHASQSLVAATPDTVGKLIKLGYELVVEQGAGDRASFPDHLYEEAGAAIVNTDEVWDSDIVFALDTPPTEYLDKMRQGATLIARMAPGRNSDTLQALAQRGITGLAMDMVPRISRAQSMDVLSSMANIAGYRAVVEAAAQFGRLFTGQVTAAGKMPPATVYVIGAGVAGLAAIGTANSMGAVVNATDVRDETAEQVESMGAQFVAIPAPAQESSDGYAKEMTADQAAAAAKLYAEQASISDVVITTANIPGRKSPILLDAEAVANMKPGSVVVDMAAANGGNCELTVPGEVITTENGVKIIGYTDLAGRLPAQASQLYGQNLVNFFKLTTPEKDGILHLDLDDVVVRQMTVTLNNDVLFPPPPVQVSAAPAAKKPVANVAPAEPEPEKSWFAKNWWMLVVGVLFASLIISAPPGMTSHFIVFALAVVVGFYVITSVTHSLHTPLMSVTNAISGIIVVGALLQVPADSIAVKVLTFFAIVVASINVFGGFTVTHRMLKMFQRS